LAINSLLLGSPGIRQVFAKSSGRAFMWGVGKVIYILLLFF
jgi:hypothetical protein